MRSVKFKSMFSTKKRIAAVALSGAVILGAAGVAAAFFTSTGTGTGQAAVGTASSWGVTAGAETGTLLPGSGTATIPFTITNNSTGAQAYSTVTAAVATDGSGNVTSGGTAVPGCLATWFTATAGTPAPVAGTSIAASGTGTDTVTVTMSDSGTNQDACESVTPDITLSVS
jgi:hypothetical protein